MLLGAYQGHRLVANAEIRLEVERCWTNQVQLRAGEDPGLRRRIEVDMRTLIDRRESVSLPVSGKRRAA